MWLFTEYGFYSIVQKSGEDCLTVRARVKADLDALRKRVPELSSTVTGGGTDYPYRAFVSHEALAAGMADTVKSIDYSNFKNRVADNLGRSRESVYHRVWAALMNLENTIMDKFRSGS